jgi:Tfp pilus assembly protein FimT
MNIRGGFSLVELIIIVVIFGFMMALGAPAFKSWQRKHSAEDQIEKLYNNLQFARMKAYTEKVTWGLWWWGGNPLSAYEIRRDNSNPPNGNISDAGDANPGSAFSLKFPVISSDNSTSSVVFDTRAVCSSMTTFYLPASTNTGASTDCVSVSRTRIRVGKLDASNRCNPK